MLVRLMSGENYQFEEETEVDEYEMREIMAKRRTQVWNVDNDVTLRCAIKEVYL